MQVEIIMPWRSGCEYRERAKVLVMQYWAVNFPEWKLTVSELPDGPWIKAMAVMPVVEQSTASVFIVADADVWTDPEAVRAAVLAIEDSGWAIPHGKVHRLSSQSTAALYKGGDISSLPLSESPYWGVEAGGLIVVASEVIRDVPMDSRFCGWGGEDHAWGFALQSLYGKPPRGDAPLWHLWHPSPPRLSRKIGSHQSEMLRIRYRDARQKAETMRKLIEEVHPQWR